MSKKSAVAPALTSKPAAISTQPLTVDDLLLISRSVIPVLLGVRAPRVVVVATVSLASRLRVKVAKASRSRKTEASAMPPGHHYAQ